MTVTHLPSGRPDRPRRHGARAIGLVGALLIGLATIGVPSAALAAGTPAPTPPASTGETTFTLSPVGNGIVRPDDALAVSVTMENGTDADLPATGVTLSLGDSPLAGRAALTAWLGGDTAGVSTEGVDQTTIDPVLAGASQTDGMRVDADDDALEDRAPGVYPLLARYESAAGSGFSTSVMIVPDEDAASVGVGIVVPITAPPISAGLLTADELTELTALGGSLSSSLDAVDGTSAILAIDPAIVAAIRVLGSAAPESATAWLERLLDLPNARFALQFGDADVATQMEAGLDEPAQPTSLQPYMSADDFAPEDIEPAATPSPTPSADEDADPDAVSFPDLDALLDIGGGRDGVFWPSASAVTADVVTQLGTVEVGERSALTLVPSTATEAGAGGATVAASASAGESDLLVYDADVSAALRDASQIDVGTLRAAPLTAATAYLAFATAESGGMPLMVTLDRATDRTRVGLATAITAAANAPGVTPVSLGMLADDSPGRAVVRDVASDDAAATQTRVDAASALFESETDLRQFATILDDPAQITGRERAEILQLLSVSWQSTVGAAEAVTAHREQTSATLSSVGILPPTSIQLLTAGADLPLWVRNDLPYPVNVVLNASPDDLRLDVQAQTPVTAQAAGNTAVKVPVQTRVGSGEVTVKLELRSPSYQLIGGTQYAEVNVRADWEGIGTVILAIIIGGLLIVGVVRMLVRRRRDAADEADAASTASEDPPSGDAQ